MTGSIDRKEVAIGIAIIAIGCFGTTVSTYAGLRQVLLNSHLIPPCFFNTGKVTHDFKQTDIELKYALLKLEN